MGKGERVMSKSRKRITGLLTTALIAVLSFYAFPFTLSPFPLAAAAGNEAALVSTATPEGRLAVFDDAWARINERYYDQTFNGLDWDLQRRTFRPLAVQTGSTEELYAVLRRMIASLNDPHTRVFAPEEKSDWWRPRFVSVGLALAEVGGLPTVIKVDNNSSAQRAGMRAGDVIESVDGEAALALVNSRLTKLSEPVSASERYRVFAKLLDGPSGTPVNLSWKEKDGKQKSVRLERYWQQRELGVRMRREQGEYAVVEIDAFTKPIAVAFPRTQRTKLSGTSGLILDLRVTRGGDAEAMSDIASTFLGVGSNLGQFTDRAGTSFTILTHFRSAFTPEPLEQTKLPLIVLTSERTASAAEIFVEALRISRRATIIGTETCGCVLAVRTRHQLPDGGLLDVSELDYETAEGHRLEGHGLKPDETVTIERSDLYSGRDRALELALKAIHEIRLK